MLCTVTKTLTTLPTQVYHILSLLMRNLASFIFSGIVLAASEQAQ